MEKTRNKDDVFLSVFRMFNENEAWIKVIFCLQS